MGKLRESLGMAVPWRICFSSSEAVTRWNRFGTIVGTVALRIQPSSSRNRRIHSFLAWGWRLVRWRSRQFFQLQNLVALVFWGIFGLDSPTVFKPIFRISMLTRGKEADGTSYIIKPSCCRSLNDCRRARGLLQPRRKRSWIPVEIGCPTKLMVWTLPMTVSQPYCVPELSRW